MLVDLLNRLLNLAEPTVLKEGDTGREYTSKQVFPMKPPEHEVLEVKTLTGFIDAAKAEIGPVDADEYCIHVVDHNEVLLLRNSLNEWYQRERFLRASCEACRFQFGAFLEAEMFIIGLQTNFVISDDAQKVLRLVSNLAAEQVQLSTDDGVSQQVATRQGVALKDAETVKPRVKLRPYRTFREIDQPASEFVLRFRSRENARPLIALFEADGAEWKNVAMQAIKTYVGVFLKDVVIVA